MLLFQAYLYHCSVSLGATSPQVKRIGCRLDGFAILRVLSGFALKLDITP